MKTIIISDTSCLIALYDIDEMSLLRKVFDEIWVTPEVRDEFNPLLPSWIFVKEVMDEKRKETFNQKVDPGEASAIALAIETPEYRLLLDDKKGRMLAASHGLTFIGTLGLLLEAKKMRVLPEVKPYLKKLKKADFWLSQKLEQEVLKKAGEDLF